VFEYGEPAFKDRNITVKSLVNSKVDLVARSIAAADSSSDLLRMTQKLDADYPDAKIPILQAVKVFRKSDDGHIFTGEASLPTFLRKEPKSFNSKQPATGFYMNISLKNNLDTKVVEFVESCRDLVRSALPNFFNPWYTMSSNKSLIKKESPQTQRVVHLHGVFDSVAVVGFFVRQGLHHHQIADYVVYLFQWIAFLLFPSAASTH
jgi:hypothetical protein